MFKKTLITLVCAFFVQNALAKNDCFIAKENGKIVKQMGDCDARHTPASTFKIPLAVMGFDSGVLKSPSQPSIPLTDDLKARIADLYHPEKYPIQYFYNRAQTPESWMMFSVIWYSQYITHQLGKEKFQEYVDKFNYGNKDISGHPGKDDGLDSAWIFSSLQISPKEQLEFIEKLQQQKLPVSKSAHENTIKIIKQANIWDDWQMYGKTGGGMTGGWFVGWIQKDERTITFAQYVELDNSPLSGGTTARELAKNNLITLILNEK